MMGEIVLLGVGNMERMAHQIQFNLKTLCHVLRERNTWSV
jgi:hypothetical protein